MERNTQKHGLINLLSLLAAGVAGLAIARYGNSLAGQVGVLFLGLGTIVALVSWFQMRLEETERLEGLELDEMAKSRGESALFENKDAELFPARRAREQYERYFVPIVTVLLAVAQGGGAYLIWRWLQRPATVESQLRQPTMVLAMFALFALVLFLLGKFSTMVARLDDQRLLRPGASYSLLGAYICFAVTLGIVAVQSGFAKADYYVACGLCVILGLVAVETVIQLVLEIYRPRVKGKVERPLYESRLVGLLGQPEGLITTAAEALDYQFGFKVSETWFYRFFERALGWLLLLQVGALVLSTCFVFVEAGEQGLLEHFGRPVEGKAILEPGVHAKWPWPIDKVRIYRTEQIQEFIVGSEPDPAREQDRIVLWTVSHAKEENFLVAHREANVAAATTQQGAKRTPPVSLLTVSIPVQYQITNLFSWAYNNEDANSLLNHAATREVVRFLVGADLNHIMSDGRWESSEELVRRVQAASDSLKLGARIISVGLQDLHPPVKVAPDYEKVVGSIQTRQAKVLAAQADAIRTNAMAEAESSTITNLATADRVSQEIGALSRAALFTNQIPAFQAAPSVYVQRSYLRAFVNATAGARKYINLATNTDDVLVIDLQDKIREDLLNTLNVPAPKK